MAGALGDNGWSQLDVPALGTTVRLFVRGGGPALLIDARQRLDDLDRRWNPARPDSLVAAVEAAAGSPVPVDDETFALIEASLRAAEATDGAVGSEGLVLNPTLTRVGVPAGAVFDVDDLARARMADSVAEAIVDAGADGAVVDVGGVLRLAGAVAEGSAWVVEVLDPDTDAVRAELGIAEGAAATIERPTATLASVTVLAPDASTAVVLAAAADAGLIEAAGLPGLLVADDHQRLALGGVERFLRS